MSRAPAVRPDRAASESGDPPLHARRAQTGRRPRALQLSQACPSMPAAAEFQANPGLRRFGCGRGQLDGEDPRVESRLASPVLQRSFVCERIGRPLCRHPGVLLGYERKGNVECFPGFLRQASYSPWWATAPTRRYSTPPPLRMTTQPHRLTGARLTQTAPPCAPLRMRL